MADYMDILKQTIFEPTAAMNRETDAQGRSNMAALVQAALAQRQADAAKVAAGVKQKADLTRALITAGTIPEGLPENTAAQLRNIKVINEALKSAKTAQALSGAGISRAVGTTGNLAQITDPDALFIQGEAPAVQAARLPQTTTQTKQLVPGIGVGQLPKQQTVTERRRGGPPAPPARPAPPAWSKKQLDTLKSVITNKVGISSDRVQIRQIGNEEPKVYIDNELVKINIIEPK